MLYCAVSDYIPVVYFFRKSMPLERELNLRWKFLPWLQSRQSCRAEMLHTFQLTKSRRKAACTVCSERHQMYICVISRMSLCYKCICVYCCRWKDNVERFKRRAQGHDEAVTMLEIDLSRLERDSGDIYMRMQALKPQIMKLTEAKNHYHRWVASTTASACTSVIGPSWVLGLVISQCHLWEGDALTHCAYMPFS